MIKDILIYLQQASDRIGSIRTYSNGNGKIELPVPAKVDSEAILTFTFDDSKKQLDSTCIFHGPRGQIFQHQTTGILMDEKGEEPVGYETTPREAKECVLIIKSVANFDLGKFNCFFCEKIIKINIGLFPRRLDMQDGL